MCQVDQRPGLCTGVAKIHERRVHASMCSGLGSSLWMTDRISRQRGRVLLPLSSPLRNCLRLIKLRAHSVPTPARNRVIQRAPSHSSGESISGS